MRLSKMLKIFADIHLGRTICIILQILHILSLIQ